MITPPQMAGFLRTVLTTAIDGEWASEETIRRRYAKCVACEFFRMRGEHGQCGVCECKIRDEQAKRFLHRLSNKLAHKSSKCPRRFWVEEE